MNKAFLYEMIQTPSPSGAEFELQKKNHDLHERCRGYI